MTHDVLDLLRQWHQSPDEAWVLAVLTQVQGSSYRKPGAMMLFHPLGKSYGMLSGGCLEADLRRHAQKVIQSQCIAQLEYDASDESDSSYQLGCGGIVNIMLVTVTKANDYLGFNALLGALTQGDSVEYQLSLPAHASPCQQASAKLNIVPLSASMARPQMNGVRHSVTPHKHDVLSVHLAPPITLGIFGAGLDAQPVAAMAQQLGWQVSVFDERSAYGRLYDFPSVKVVKGPFDTIEAAILKRLDAAVIMSHNLNLDAKALSMLVPYSQQKLAYLALLGPPQRRDRVLRLAGLTLAEFSCFFSAPAGLALGGELPSSVALSIVSQCHGVLHGSAIIPLDEVMAWS
jgi:xanthine dehydrogenase accessory factor